MVEVHRNNLQVEGDFQKQKVISEELNLVTLAIRLMFVLAIFTVFKVSIPKRTKPQLPHYQI
jgi:hypothetical protein